MTIDQDFRGSILDCLKQYQLILINCRQSKDVFFIVIYNLY